VCNPISAIVRFNAKSHFAIHRVDTRQIDLGNKLHNGRFSRVSLATDNLQAIDSIFMDALSTQTAVGEKVLGHHRVSANLHGQVQE
jgi:hypothetical protein